MQKHSRLAIIGLILASISLRVWGAFADLPYIFHPDEPSYISIIQRIFRTGDLNPHFFHYPSMFLYVNALAHIPYYLLGRLAGEFSARNDILAPTSLIMGTSLAPTPSSVILSRSVTILFATVAVVLLFFIGRRLTNNTWVGLLAALMMTISPTNVANSRFITPDTYVVFWGLVTLLASTLIFQQGKTWHYVLSGLSVGFTASSKYNGALIMLCVVTAHFIRNRWSGIRDRRLYLSALLSVMGFILVTPFSILDYQHFVGDLMSEAKHYSTGHAGMEGNALGWYASYLWKTEGVMSVLALIQIIRGLYLRSKETILLSVFTVVYLAFISSYVVRNDRTILPAVPFMILLSSILLVDLFGPKFLDSKVPQAVVKRLAFALTFVALVIPLWNTVQTSIGLTALDSRTTARLWINSNLPKGAKVAIESYSPFINAARFSIQGVVTMIENRPEWYITNGFDYLVFSQDMFGRFYKEPDKYASEIARYNSLFDAFSLLKTFNEGGYEIRVYQVKKTEGVFRRKLRNGTRRKIL